MKFNVTMARKITVVRYQRQSSINTSRMDRNAAPQHLGILYLLSAALLSVSNHPTTEETLYLLLVAMCVDSGGVENDEEGHRSVHQEDKGTGL